MEQICVVHNEVRECGIIKGLSLCQQCIDALEPIMADEIFTDVIAWRSLKAHWKEVAERLDTIVDNAVQDSKDSVPDVNPEPFDTEAEGEKSMLVDPDSPIGKVVSEESPNEGLSEAAHEALNEADEREKEREAALAAQIDAETPDEDGDAVQED